MGDTGRGNTVSQVRERRVEKEQTASKQANEGRPDILHYYTVLSPSPSTAIFNKRPQNLGHLGSPVD